jgi:hypothetical protein
VNASHTRRSGTRAAGGTGHSVAVEILASVPARRVELRLSVERRVVQGDDSEFGDVVWIEINGERLAPIEGKEYLGLAPSQLLRQLLPPNDQPDETVIGRCTCGEVGCGCVTVRSYTLDPETIVWDLLQAGNPPPPDLGQPRPAPGALLFDRLQYLNAIEPLKSA